MKIKPWISENAGNFWLFSEYPDITSNGELIEKALKSGWRGTPRENKRNSNNLTSIIWSIWERTAQSLLPPSTIKTSQKSPYDFELSSWIDWSRLLLELKTAQMRNRWVIRKGQIARYMTVSNNSLIYFAQLFYQTRSGRIPSKVAITDLENEFLPLCIYIFPISFVLYMVSTCQPCWHNPETQFYAMTQYRAQSLYNLAEWGHAINNDWSSYTTQIFRTNNLEKNPEMPLYIVDHKNTPHILSHITQSPPLA